MALDFRRAVAADAPAIRALVESAYRGDSGRRGWTTESDLLDGQRTDVAAVRALIADPAACVLLAEVAGALRGCCQLERHGELAYFGMFAVDPAQQNGGTGRALLARAEALARDDWRCTRMEMTVIAQRAELIAWYVRRGYHLAGEQRAFPYGDPRFGLPRRDDLYFEVLRKALG